MKIKNIKKFAFMALASLAVLPAAGQDLPERHCRRIAGLPGGALDRIRCRVRCVTGPCREYAHRAHGHGEDDGDQYRKGWSPPPS